MLDSNKFFNRTASNKSTSASKSSASASTANRIMTALGNIGVVVEIDYIIAKLEDGNSPLTIIESLCKRAQNPFAQSAMMAFNASNTQSQYAAVGWR